MLRSALLLLISVSVGTAEIHPIPYVWLYPAVPELLVQPAVTLEQQMAFTERYEGRMPRVYRCSAGSLSIGVGHNLDRGDSKLRLVALGLPWTKLRNGIEFLNDEQITRLYRLDMLDAMRNAEELVSGLRQMPRDVQLVVTDMVFNLGRTGFLDFADFRCALLRSDWRRAANEMRKSHWFSQVGSRGRDLVRIMRQQ